MAKKQETKIETVETPKVVEQPKVKTPVMEIPKPKKDNWEIKDRAYYLKGRARPVSKSIRSSNIFWFDEEEGYQRELKYCKNQQTCFVDEMKGDQRLSHIIFRNGALFVSKEETVLQKLLSLYHPHKDSIFFEHKPSKIAEEHIDVLEREADAIVAARDIDIDMAEAIMRTEIGSKVSNLSSSELKRDLLIFARKNPELFLQLIGDDNVQLRNFGIKAVETGVIKISRDQRNFLWSSNDRKLMTIPYDEHPYSALAAWFKTDEGMEIYANIEKRLNN